MALLQGHTEAVLAVAFSKKGTAGSCAFVISAGKDRTIKSWDISSLERKSADNKPEVEGTMATLSSRFTVRGHDKDVNALAVAPNDSVFASASQDKTVKVGRPLPQQPISLICRST